MSARRAIRCLMLYSMMLIASARAQSLLVDVVTGFDGKCSGEGCFPVTVWIQGERANAPPAVCEVEVKATSWNGSVSARKLVTLPGGLVSQSTGFLLCTPDEPYAVTARLILRGRVLAVSQPSSVGMLRSETLLVGLGTETSSLTHVPALPPWMVRREEIASLPGSSHRSVPPYPSYDSVQKHLLFIGRTRYSLPPDSALAYRGVAAVSLDDRNWDTLTERQQQALTGYVLSGGLLVVHGVDINRLQSLMPSGLLPVEPLGLSQVPAYALAKWVPSLSRSTAAVAVVRTRPLGGAKTILTYRDIPLVVTAPKGLGQVVFLAFDPSQPPFTSDSPAYSLWKNLLRLQERRFSPPAAIFPNIDSSLSGGPQPRDQYLYADLVRVMVNSVAAKPVALNWLITYLAVYILVLIPLNYVVLRRLDRLHLSWYSLPLLAVLTSMAGFLVAPHVQAGAHQMHQWTVLYTTSGSPQAIVESDWVLYSARSQRYRLQAKVDATILENSPSDLQARRVAETPQDEPADLRDVPIPLWSARSFHLSGRVNMSGSVSATAERERNMLRLRVRNNTPYTLKITDLVMPSGVAHLGATCSPGGQLDLKIRPDVQRPASWEANSPSHLPYGSPSYSPPEVANNKDWRELARDRWLGMVWTRLPKPESARRTQGVHTNFPLAVLVAEVDGFPQVVEVTPLPSSSVQQNTLLAIPLNVQGGER